MDKATIQIPTTAARRRLNDAIIADYTKFVAFDVLGRDAKDIRTLLIFANKHGISKDQIYRDIFHAGMVEMTKRGFEMLKKGNALDRYANSLPKDIQEHGGWVW